VSALVRLRPYGDADAWLVEAIEGDPRMMADLGGATPRERFADVHSRRVAGELSGAHHYFVVETPGAERVLGTIGIWASRLGAEEILEAGWMILPGSQGRGYATAAGRALLELARERGLRGPLHAFPAAANRASNAVCRKLGFTLAGEVDLSYNGPAYRCNDWRVDL